MWFGVVETDIIPDHGFLQQWIAVNKFSHINSGRDYFCDCLWIPRELESLFLSYFSYVTCCLTTVCAGMENHAEEKIAATRKPNAFIMRSRWLQFKPGRIDFSMSSRWSCCAARIHGIALQCNEGRSRGGLQILVETTNRIGSCLQISFGSPSILHGWASISYLISAQQYQ